MKLLEFGLHQVQQVIFTLVDYELLYTIILFAKKNNGTFVLRIEDTDRNRYVEGAVENLINALKWAGLEFDEGPEVGGNFGPYMQSTKIRYL